MARPRVVGEWPAQGVTFETERGSFVIPGDVLARADATGDDFEVRRTIARALDAHPDATVYRREKAADGSLRLSWRVVRVVAAPAAVEAF